MQQHASIHGLSLAATFTAVQPVRQLGAWLKRLPALYDDYRSRRQATAVLCGHTDRELADLGVTRADIPALVADGRYRRVLGVASPWDYRRI